MRWIKALMYPWGRNLTLMVKILKKILMSYIEVDPCSWLFQFLTNFLLMQTFQVNGDGLGNWAHFTSPGDWSWIPSSWLWPLVKANACIWGVNCKISAIFNPQFCISLSASQINKFRCFYIFCGCLPENTTHLY